MHLAFGVEKTRHNSLHPRRSMTKLLVALIRIIDLCWSARGCCEAWRGAAWRGGRRRRRRGESHLTRWKPVLHVESFCFSAPRGGILPPLWEGRRRLLPGSKTSSGIVSARFCFGFAVCKVRNLNLFTAIMNYFPAVVGSFAFRWISCGLDGLSRAVFCVNSLGSVESALSFCS